MNAKTVEREQETFPRRKVLDQDLAQRRAAVRRLRALQAELAATYGKFEDSVKVLAKTRARNDDER